ncbi:MAG TPA: YvcK family protein [Syntrophomonadaceae bacterium]|nr:YvcK family protein [Syntrophomonadaceae bacterium]HPR93851.1 YvcK family protein [Syntrophomonadaceae bacterium]
MQSKIDRSGNEPKIVVIGGGTGLPVLLKGLKNWTSELTAIVTVTDDGGSSGRLRTELGVLPPGDIRSCLVALAETETLMDKVFQHRFGQGDSIKGHNLGNLLLVAMTEIAGDFVSAIKEVSKVLKVRGQVIPVTLEPVNLVALMADGITVKGETSIREYPGCINKLWLTPENCHPVPAVLEAISEADAVVIGPGSLFTSIIPNLLVDGVTEAISRSKAKTIFISNIMTELGETDDFTAADHLRSLLHYIESDIIDYVLVNTGHIDEIRLSRYREEKALPVDPSSAEIEAMGYTAVEEDLVSDDDVAWHDSDKLARIIMDIIGY